MQTARKLQPHSARSKHAAIVAAVTLYYVAFNWDRIRTYFAADDMMNMGQYFLLGPSNVLASQVLLWKGFYRPMGAAFYLPLYHWFGLNPAPFQATIFIISAINAILLYCLAVTLGAGELAAGLAALVVAYHAGLTNLVYNIDMVYDVLCFLFFIGAMLVYARARKQGRRLGWRQGALFLLLYLCALNSKEMALTMPLVLVAYEWCYQRRETRWWTMVDATGALAAVSLYGKKFGVQPLLDAAAYHPVFSLRRFLDFQRGSLHDLFGDFGTPGWGGVALIWALVTFLAWRQDRPLVRFSWAWMLLTPLPIAFLTARFQGCLYIPLAGWAIFASVASVDLAQALSAVLVKEPLFRLLSRSRVFALLIACAVFLWADRMRYLKSEVVKPAAAVQGMVTAPVIRQLRLLNPHVEPRSQVVFLNDPFEDWDMVFIANLWFADRTVHVHNQRREHLSASEIARMNHVFDFRDGKLMQLK